MKVPAIACACLAFTYFAGVAGACEPVRRALVVGINLYTGNRKPGVRVEKPLVARQPVDGAFHAREFGNLEGAVNDATEFAAFLEGEPYRFEERNIKLLLEEQATAQNILDTFERHLIDASTCPGDVSIFFYSGHGSQIRNTSVKNENSPDSYDETLIPYDAADGAADIRSKELVRMYLKAARKGIYLTVIADSCQSGGLSRGASDFSRAKSGIADSRTVNDPGERGADGNRILPTRRSSGLAHPVLLLSAAYEKETAKEATSGRHGVFTAALLDKLRNHPQHEAIGTLFADVKLAVAMEQNDQHPQIEGEGRMELDLLGQPAESATGMIAWVANILPDGRLVIDKGKAADIYENCELVSAMPEAPDVRIKIVEAHLADSIATAGPGGALIQPSWRFRLDRWVVPKNSSLSVYIEKNGPPPEELARAAQAVAQLASAGVKAVADPTVTSPTHQIWWLDGQWQLLGGGPGKGGKGTPLGKSLDAARIGALIPKDANLFVNYPLPAEQAGKLELGQQTRNDAVTVQASPNAPQYILAGRWNGKGFEYAWVRPGVMEADQKGLNLPVRTDWVAANEGFEADLRAKALQLNRIYGWLTLSVPGGGTGKDLFPYRLELRKAGSDEPLKPGRDHTAEGETYKLWLTATPAELAAVRKTSAIEQRWVYVLVIDRDGSVAVLHPAGGSNTGNHLPPEGDGPPPAQIPMTDEAADVKINPPFGLDTYILLTSREELDPRLFPAQGVRSEALTRGGGNPLASLLGGIGNTRGASAISAVPTNWSVQTLSLPSVGKDSTSSSQSK